MRYILDKTIDTVVVMFCLFFAMDILIDTKLYHIASIVGIAAILFTTFSIVFEWVDERIGFNFGIRFGKGKKWGER